MDINTCFETTYEVRSLSLYAHLAPSLASIALGWFAFRYAQIRSKSILFFAFTILLSLWLIGDLILWNTNNYYWIGGIWSVLDYINILFFLVLLGFLYTDFSKNSKFSPYILLTFMAVSIYPLLLTLAGLSVAEFDQPNCEMYENEHLSNYKLILEWVVISLILILGISRIIRSWKNSRERMRAAILTIAVALFMGIFSGSEYIASITEVYEINLYALFTLPFLILLITYTVIEHNTFRFSSSSIIFVRLLFVIFVGIDLANLFLTESSVQFFVTAAGTVITVGFGLLVLRGATREARQKEEIEKLAKRLEQVNKRLKILDQLKSEFVSIASHQLRSPLTSIRGYSSMLLEGSFGKLPQKAHEAIERISDSSRYMALSVEDYLNVSRIESGRMKYELSDFNLRDIASRIVDDLRSTAIKHGLVLTFKSSDSTSRCLVHADIGKVQQIIHNLIDNAIKYTQKGSITVCVRDNIKKKRIYIDVIDTGVGMDSETQEEVFEKFVRARNANKVNVTGTGLGLYVAKQMAEGMKGKISVTSEGEGKGSTFTLELPLLM